MRFNPKVRLDKTLDDTFDGDGKRTIDYGGATTRPGRAGAARQPRSCSPATATARRDFAVTRLNPDGSDERSFGGDGTAGVDFGGY